MITEHVEAQRVFSHTANTSKAIKFSRVRLTYSINEKGIHANYLYFVAPSRVNVWIPTDETFSFVFFFFSKISLSLILLCLGQIGKFGSFQMPNFINSKIVQKRLYVEMSFNTLLISSISEKINIILSNRIESDLGCIIS